MRCTVPSISGARRARVRRTRRSTTWMVAVAIAGGVIAPAAAPASAGRLTGGAVLRVSVPEAFGGKTVVGQLTVDQVVGGGFVTAYGCDDGIPRDARGEISRSDLNYDGTVSPVASNRLIVKADDDGDVCFFTLRPAALIVDVNGVTFDTGISSFANRRTDTRDRRKQRVAGGAVLRVSVPEASGGKTVVGQLTVDRVVGGGFVTAYGCDDGIPQNANGTVRRSDLNYDGTVSPVASNRLIVKADDDGDVCFFTLRSAAIIVDVNGVSDTGISSFPNRRTDTRDRTRQRVPGRAVVRVSVPEASGGKTVVGQLTVDQVVGRGFVTAYGCDDGIPRDAGGAIDRSDLNYDGHVSPVASNRLIVKADDDGDVCFFTLRSAAIIVDVNGVSDTGISSFPNRRTDTRTDTTPSALPGPTDPDGVPVWPPYSPLPPVRRVAALTGKPARASVTRRPILVAKIDNYRVARPQFGLELADVVIEQNVEGVTRFVALFHSRLPAEVGPIRSARTGDLDLVAGMNRPVFAYSGANGGVMAWIDSASDSGVVVDFTAQRNPCFGRTDSRPGPHNLLLDPTCAVVASPTAGPARPLWPIDAGWTPAGLDVQHDSAFVVPMDGVQVGWSWDATSRTYLRTQDGSAHLAESGRQISARNVVEISSVHVPSPVDARSPHAITTGAGDGVVHRDGIAIPIVWSRATADAPFEFLHATSGVSIPLDRGASFVELRRG